MSINPRPRRPYEKKNMSKSGAIIFGLGLGALMATLAIIVGLILPDISPKLDNLAYRARSYYRKLLPHPEYLPTPVPTVSAAEAQPNNENIQLDLPPVPTVNIPPQDLSVTIIEDASLENEAQGVAAQATIADAPLPSQIQLDGISHQWQTWNNCGPSTITMNMSYFGKMETQVEAAKILKPNRDDKNVSPHELAAYARSIGLEAIVRRDGSVKQLQQFLSHNIPVLTETWLVHDGDGLGHYRLLTGYDDVAAEFNTYDSLNGPNYKVGYRQFNEDWQVFNRLYIVVYPPEQADTVNAIIGEEVNNTVMYENTLAQALSDTSRMPNSSIGYFNQGDALTRLGRYEEAVQAFDTARQAGLHWRRLWYQFTPYEAYYAMGRYQDVLDLTEATLKGTGGLEEAYYYHGLALLATGQPGAEEDFLAALEYNPLFTPAQEMLNQLEQTKAN